MAMKNSTLTGNPAVDWTRKSAQAREAVTDAFVATRHLSSKAQLRAALREKYDRARAMDRGQVFRRTRASCGGKLDLPGWRHFVKLCGIGVTNPAGRDVVKEVWQEACGPSGVIEFQAFTAMCFGNKSLRQNFNGPSASEEFKRARARDRRKHQDSQATRMFQSLQVDHMQLLRDKLARRGKESFSEKFALLQNLASYANKNLKLDGFAVALKKLGMQLSVQETTDMFRKVDFNNDGEVDFSEFCAVIMDAPGYNVPKGKLGRSPKLQSKKAQAFARAERTQQVADAGFHLIKDVDVLKDVVQQCFNKLDSGISASASFRRLKRAAGAVIDAVQFQGFMKFIRMNKIPATPELVRKLFSRMLRHTKPPKNKKKSAFTFTDFKIEFFAQQATSAHQEADYLLMAQMEKKRARERAQLKAQQEMAGRIGVHLDPNAFVAGADPMKHRQAQASNRSRVRSRSPTTNRSTQQSPIRGAASGVLSKSDGSPKFSALPKPRDPHALQKAVHEMGSPGNGGRTRSSRSKGQQQRHVAPRGQGNHMRADPRINLQAALKTKGIHARRSEVDRLMDNY